MLDEVPEALHAPVQALIAQVEAARRQIQALRSENKKLKDRVDELEQRPEIDPLAKALPLDEDDPEAISTALTAYIEAVDALLSDLPPAPEAPTESDVPADDASPSA